MAKEAIFVCGPESSGTRMITQFCMSGGFDGDSGHSQRWDHQRFGETPDKIVFRRSLPHGGQWSPIGTIHHKLLLAKYNVKVVFTWRDPIYMSLSQKRAGHVENRNKALDQIAYALLFADDQFTSAGITPYTVVYERIVTNTGVQNHLRQELGLGDSNFNFHNANNKYTERLDEYDRELMRKVTSAKNSATSIFSQVEGSGYSY